MRTDTAANVINKAMLEMALVSAAVSNVYTSTDAMVAQLRALLEGLGQDLVHLRPWTHLQKEHTLSTANGTYSYALPSGYVAMVSDTHWNRTTGLSLPTAVSGQGWQALVSAGTGAATKYFYRVQGNRLLLTPTPTAAETLVFEYTSAYWVLPSGQTSPTTEAPSANTDTLWFDRRLLVAGLKLRWLEAKGFETTAAQRAYDAALSAAMGGDGAHSALDLAAGAVRRGPALPETDWGV